MEHKLARNPSGNWSTHIDIYIESVYHFKKRFACLLRATHHIKCFTKALPNCEIKIVKFPSRYLTKREVSFDSFQLYPLASLPVRPPRALDSCDAILGFVHIRTIQLLSHSCCSPYASFQQEDTYTVAQKSVPMFACFSLKSITPNRI